MALIECKYCGKPVSDKATVCPRCGYRVATNSYSTEKGQLYEMKKCQMEERLKNEQQFILVQQNENRATRRKKLLVAMVLFLIVVFAIFYISSSDYRNYKKAQEAYKTKDYLVALQLFEELNGYEDSNEKFIDCLTCQIELLLSINHYEEVLSLAAKYQNISDECQMLFNDATQKADNANKYDELIDILYNQNQKSQRPSVIKQLKDLGNIKNAQKIVNSYEVLSKSPFIGKWKSGPNKSKIGTEYMCYLTFEIEFIGNEFRLNTVKKVCNKNDLSLALIDKSYSFGASHINNNTIKMEKYSWSVNGSQLVEIDAGNQYIYKK